MSGPEARPNGSKAFKTISFQYKAPEELYSLLENFRLMCNDAIRIATQNVVKSKFELQRIAYSRLKLYGLQTHYISSALEVGYSIYRNKGRKSTPYVRKAFLKLDTQTYQLNHLILRIPVTPHHFIFLTLRGSDYHTSMLDDPTLKRGSVTINSKNVCIAFSRSTSPVEQIGSMGIDLNERNVTISTTNGFSRRFNEFVEIAEIRERYRIARARIDRRVGRDRRIATNLLSKYGKREHNRTTQRAHKISKVIVTYALSNKLRIKMERLTGIRKLFQKGGGHTPSFRGRMNTWAFREVQHQIEYKAIWNGIEVTYVNPKGSSSHCLCGSRVVPLPDRKVYCPRCDITWDRDDLASKQIMACVVPQARPSRGSGEGERGDDGSNPQSRWREVSSGGHEPKS